MSIDLAPFVEVIRSRIDYVPEVGIVCGSGLSNIASLVQNPITIPYHELGADFPHSAVQGHKSELVCGQLGSKNVICFRGRFHFYEGWTTQQSVIAVRLMAALGVRVAIITNAAGGLDPEYKVGDVMVINDHINFLGMTGANPLMGPNVDEEGPRFPPITAYDKNLQKHFAERYQALAPSFDNQHVLRHGCYVGLSGPNYETPSEVQFLRTVGGHAVGMSTVNEVVQASHVGLKVFGLSLITNSGIGTTPADQGKPIPDHSEVIEETKKVEAFLTALMADFVDSLDLTPYAPAPMAALYTEELLIQKKIDRAVAAAAAADNTVVTTTTSNDFPLAPVLIGSLGSVFAVLLGAAIAHRHMIMAYFDNE